jgi:hypothetical protein
MLLGKTLNLVANDAVTKECRRSTVFVNPSGAGHGINMLLTYV